MNYSIEEDESLFSKDSKSYLAVPLLRLTSMLRTTYFIALILEHKAISFYILLSYPNIEDSNE